MRHKNSPHQSGLKSEKASEKKYWKDFIGFLKTRISSQTLLLERTGNVLLSEEREWKSQYSTNIPVN